MIFYYSQTKPLFFFSFSSGFRHALAAFDTFSSLHQKLPTSQLTGRLLRCTSCLHTHPYHCPVFSFFSVAPRTLPSFSHFLLLFAFSFFFFSFFSPRCLPARVLSLSKSYTHYIHTYIYCTQFKLTRYSPRKAIPRRLGSHHSCATPNHAEGTDLILTGDKHQRRHNSQKQ